MASFSGDLKLTEEEREKLTKALLNPDKNWIMGLNNQLKEIRKHMKIVKKTDKCVSVEFDDLDLSFLDKKEDEFLETWNDHYKSGTKVKSGFVSSCCDMWVPYKTLYCPFCASKMKM